MPPPIPGLFNDRSAHTRATLNHDSGLHPAGETRGAAFQVYSLHPRLPVPAFADQIPEIFPSDFALLPDRTSGISRLAELLDTGLQAGTQGLGRVAEDLAHFPRNAGAVGVGVVDCGEGVSNASGEPWGERVGNRGEEITCG